MNQLHGQTITPELRDEWLEARKTRLGASEIAAAIGINQYDSMLRLWLTKTNRLPPKEETTEMEMGNLLEPVILDLYQRRTGNKITQTQVFCISDTHDYLCATLDGITSENTLVQVKNVGYQSSLSWGPDGTDEVPHAVIAQVQQEMFCSGLDLAHVVALIGGNDLRIYEIARDNRIIKHLIKRGEDFIQRVRLGIYPEPDPERDQDIVKFLYPDCDGTITLDDDQTAVVLEWERVHRELKLLEKEEKQLKMKLILGMGDARQGQLSNGQILYRSITTVPPCVIERKGYSFPVFKIKGETYERTTGDFSQDDSPVAS